MVKYVLKRLGFMLLTFFILLAIDFVVIKLVEPVLPINPEFREAELAFRRAMGYDKPIMVQLFIYIKNIITRFDWGYSFKIQYLVPVSEVIATRMPPTLIINVFSLLFSLPIGIGLGIYAALRKNKWQDHTISTFVMLFISVPSFVYAFLVQYIFAHKLKWFPLQVRTLADAGGSWFSPLMFASMILPILSLSFGEIASYTRTVRAELSEVLTGEFMLLARTKGLTKMQATIRHGFKNAMVPIMPMMIGSFVSILAGSLIIENIFGIPGVGGLWLNSIYALDYNVFIAVGSFYTFIGLLAGIVTDISYGFIDPRIRMGAKK